MDAAECCQEGQVLMIILSDLLGVTGALSKIPDNILL